MNPSKQQISDIFPIIFSVFVLFVLYVGWKIRRFDLITPGHGFGLIFGIIGTAMMLFLLIYPLRKRTRIIDSFGSTKVWFRIHMILGIVGPVFILFHCNFHWGSLNSNVALLSMLIVSTSGVLGRYFYSRIHYGLYGQKTNLIDLQQKLEQQKDEVGLEFSSIPSAREELVSFAKEVVGSSSDVVDSLGRLVSVRLRAMHIRNNIRQLIAANPLRSQIDPKVKIFLNQALKVSEFNLYERLFSLWHLLHLPLVYILGFAVIIHVFAVSHY